MSMTSQATQHSLKSSPCDMEQPFPVASDFPYPARGESSSGIVHAKVYITKECSYYYGTRY